MFQIIQDTVFKTFIQKELPHAFDDIINNGQIEFGLQELKLLNKFIPLHIEIVYALHSELKVLKNITLIYKTYTHFFNIFWVKVQYLNNVETWSDVNNAIAVIIENCRHLAFGVNSHFGRPWI